MKENADYYMVKILNYLLGMLFDLSNMHAASCIRLKMQIPESF